MAAGNSPESDPAGRRETEMITILAALVAQLAHEVNNPLAGIRNSFHLVRGAIPTTHPHYQYVGAIDREVTRLAEVTRRLHDTYAPFREYPAGTSAASVIFETIDLLRLMQTVPIDLEVDEDAAIGIEVSGGLLRHGLQCLAQLAIDASPAGARVTIVGKGLDGGYRLSVADSGPELSPDLSRFAVEPLEKPSGKMNGTATAIRLAMARRSAEGMNAKLSWHSAAGGGNEYRLEFPTGAAA